MHIINGSKEKNIFNKKSGFGKWFAKNGYYFLLIACFGVIAATALWSLGSDGNSNTDISLSTAPATTDWSLYIPTNTPKSSQDVDANAKPTTTPKPTATKGSSTTNSQTSTFMMPVNGTLLEPFSMEALVYSDTLSQWMTHNGMDIQANEGSDVVAAAAGTVESAGMDTMMGCTVVINHGNGLKSVYASLKEAAVKTGDTVVKGQIIGKVGSTAITETKLGAHLHFAAIYNDEYVDPSLYLPGGTK